MLAPFFREMFFLKNQYLSQNESKLINEKMIAVQIERQRFILEQSVKCKHFGAN